MDSLVTANRSFPLPWTHGTDPAARYLARLGPGSRPTQASALREIAELITGRNIDPALLPWHWLTVTQADALAAKIRESYSTRTANRYFAAIRGVLHICLVERWLVVPDHKAPTGSDRSHEGGARAREDSECNRPTEDALLTT